MTRTMPFVGLTVLAAPHVQQVAPNLGDFDFGQTDVLDKPSVEQTFTLRNDSKAPLTLAHMAPSCHCTSAVITPTAATFASRLGSSSASPSSDGTSFPTLAPGQTTTVRVTVLLEGHPTGPLAKSVSIYIAGNSRPAAMLYVTGTLQPSLSFTPTLLDFGTAPAGKDVDRTVRVTVDSRLAPHGHLPPLLSSNSNIRVAEVPQAVPKGNVKAADVKAAKQPRFITRAFTVTLPRTAPLGPISASLGFVHPPLTLAPSSPGGTPTTFTPGVYSPLMGASALVVGRVTGAVSVTPTALSFGRVLLSQDVRRQILLSGTATTLRGMKVTSGSPYVSVRLRPVPDGGDPSGLTPASPEAGQVADMTLSNQTPLGLLQTELKVTLTNGQHLLLPVSADIVASLPQ